MDSSKSPVLGEVEMEVVGGLMELQFLRKRRVLVENLVWGAKRPRSAIRLALSNYFEGGPKNAEETEEEAPKVGEEAPPVIMRKIRIVRPSDIVARVVEAEPALKAQRIAALPFTASPTSPLIQGSISVSSHGEPSDSNSSLGLSARSPRDRPLAPKRKFKVETKAEVQSSPYSRHPKKKTVAELKQRYIQQLMLNEEMEKERKMWVGYHESLLDENKSLKEQLVLKSGGREEDKHYLHTSDSSQQKMLSDSRVKQSSSSPGILPDLNIPLGESSDNSSADFQNQLLETDKLVAAAHARKYRVEYLRYKQSKFGNVQSK